VNIILLRGDGG